jgi:hypothetical protein
MRNQTPALIARGIVANHLMSDFQCTPETHTQRASAVPSPAFGTILPYFLLRKSTKFQRILAYVLLSSDLKSKREPGASRTALSCLRTTPHLIC